MPLSAARKRIESKEYIVRTAIFISRLRGLLWILVGLIILEGFLRKLLGPSSGKLLFFGKDVIALLLGLMLLFHRFEGPAEVFQTAYGVFFALMLVPFALTLDKDPVLAVFGFKQYVLYPVIVLALWEAYRRSDTHTFKKFFDLPVRLLIPVGILALVQLKLPSASWLNLSVGGTDISGFAAGGKLRVSATFPFVAQFAWYLNAMVYMLGVYHFAGKKEKGFGSYLFVALCGLWLMSSFVTGSRTAVLGNAAIIAIAVVLLIAKGNGKASASFLGTLVVGAVVYFAVKNYFPEAFQAYEARSSGVGERSQENEMKSRMNYALFDWMTGIEGAPASAFGYGLGVMSNGSGLVSQYAADWRNKGIWGEADLPNTLFEGGWYLVFVWMGFRFFAIGFTLQRVMSLRDPQLVTAGCLAAAYVVLEGIIATLAVQPPLSIWFWIAVGTTLVLEHLDKTQMSGIQRDAGAESDLIVQYAAAAARKRKT